MFYHAVKQGVIDAARSIQVGLRTFNEDSWGFNQLKAQWVHEHGCDAVVDEIRRVVGDDACYLTFDIDCLDPSYAPGTAHR